MFNFLWAALVMITVLLFGVYLTIRLGFIQINDFKRGWNKMFRSNQSEDGLSAFSAASLAIGGRIGTGNIAGVALAIYLCGYGVMFWLWVAGFFGMAISFVETTLAQIYKEYDEDHTFVSGPMIYIKRGLGPKYRKLGRLYGVLLVFTFGFTYILIHASLITQSVLSFSGVVEDLPLEMFLAFIIMILAGYILIGGTKKVAGILAYIVPVMILSYVILVFTIALSNLSFIPQYFILIFSNAFTTQGVMGGSVLVMIVVGSTLATVSSEAGLGTSTLAGGLANGDHPVQQGFANMITIFLDILVCSLTAFVIMFALSSDANYVDVQNTSDLAMKSFAFAYDGGALVLLSFILVFSFSTLITSVTYGMQVIKMLMLNNTYKCYRRVLVGYIGGVLGLILISPLLRIDLNLLTMVIFDATIVMLAINIFAIFKLKKVAIRALKHYHEVNHKFKAEEINVEYKDGINDIWI